MVAKNQTSEKIGQPIKASVVRTTYNSCKEEETQMTENNLYDKLWANEEDMQAVETMAKLESEPVVEEIDTTMVIDNDSKVVSSKHGEIAPIEMQVTQKAFSRAIRDNLEPQNGSLTGSFEDCLNYLDWAINVSANKGKMTRAIKGNAIANAIQTLNDRFGLKVSTHYLKQFSHRKPKSEKVKPNKNKHIKSVLEMADLKTTPVRMNFDGNVVNGIRCRVPKVFDMVVSRQDWEASEDRAKQFKEKCIAEWNAKAMELERQKLNVVKLKMVSEGEEINHAELEELAPDLKAQDRELIKAQHRF